MAKISTYSPVTPVGADYVLGDQASGPTTKTFLFSAIRAFSASSSLIFGLTPTWVSGTGLGASPGGAYIEGLGGYVICSPANITSLSVSNNTQYHLYLYAPDLSTTPTLVFSTTAPATTAFAGTARSASASIGGNAANLHRYLGTVISNGSAALYQFQAVGDGGYITYTYINQPIASTPWRVVNGVSKTTSAQSVDLTAGTPPLCPANVVVCVLPTVTSVTSTGGWCNLIITLINNNTSRFCFTATTVTAGQNASQVFAIPVLAPGNPSFYWYNYTGDVSDELTYMDCYNYTYVR